MRFYILFIISQLTILTSCICQSNSNLEERTKIGTVVSEMSKEIWYVFQASNGDYWFGSDTSGAFRYNESGLVKFTANDGLASNGIRGIQEDKLGNIYFATLAGINKFDGKKFTLLNVIKSTFPGDNWKLNSDDLWFNTLGKDGEKGPSRYDGKNLYQLQFPKSPMEDDYFMQFPNNAWSPYDVYYSCKDTKGHMWFGTSNLGICRYDGTSFSWLYEDHLTNTPGGGSFGIRSILEDRSGKFWICNTQYRYEISSENLTNSSTGTTYIQYNKEQGIAGIHAPDGTPYDYFLSAIEDKEGNLWLVTYDRGVYRYDGKTVTHFDVTNNGKSVTLFTIYQDKKGTIWLGTHKNGAYIFKGKKFEPFEP